MIRTIGVVLALLAAATISHAQEIHRGHPPADVPWRDHARGHAFYQGWVNKVDRRCCDNQDCGTLPDADERTTATGGIEVRVEGTWCEIKPHHYLKSGNAPDWSTAHVCVLKAAPWQIVGPCDRLLCFQPKPGT